MMRRGLPKAAAKAKKSGSMKNESRFVVDGCCRARSAAEPAIRAQVVAEFSVQLAAAGLWRRFWLWPAIECEVQRRLGKVAPPDALY
jgi:hypothetical protein